MVKINSKTYEDKRLQELASEVVSDFERRREERKSLEEQWKLNLNYLAGNQYCEISPTGEVREENKYYGWQSRSVFNHIAPIIDTRLAKLTRVRPKMSVRAFGGDEEDLKTAQISSDILNSTYQRKEIDSVISKATRWAETCGSAFYKITWDNNLGKKIGAKDGESVFETWQNLHDKIKQIHIKDAKPHPDPAFHDWYYTKLGEGELPIREVVECTQKDGYKGYYSLEWESAWRPEIKDTYSDADALLSDYKTFMEALLK